MVKTVVATLVWFAFLVAMNGHHLGADAALHWDAVEAVAGATPMPTAAQLAAARPHVFDLAREAGAGDPATVTAYFLSPAAAGRHGPLETVRRYYSQSSFALARAAFAAGGWATGSPTGGIVASQLTAAAAMAAGLGLLTALAMRQPRSPTQWALAALAAVAVAGSPVFLSLSRQMLTETAGWLCLIPGLRLMAGRRAWLSAAGGCVLFAAVRSRYNLAPAVPLLLLVTWSVTAWPRPAHMLVACATFALCVAADGVVYGPWIFPWAYAEALVRTTRLYFHTDPPYDAFYTALLVNGPMLVIPALAVGAGLIASPNRGGGFDRHWWRPKPPPRPEWVAAAVLALLVVPVIAMARQQVGYQPRHLFAVTGPAAVVLLLVVPTIRWRPWTGVPFAAVCGAVIAANVYSTLDPQRTTMRTPWPTTVMQALRHRWTTLGPHEPWPAVLLHGYFDWSDNRRVHDPLVALRYARHVGGRPLLVVSGGVNGSGLFCRWATQFGPPATWWPATGVGDAAAVRAALAAGRPVLAVLPIGAPLPGFRTRVIPVGLDQCQLCRVAEVDDGR